MQTPPPNSFCCSPSYLSQPLVSNGGGFGGPFATPHSYTGKRRFSLTADTLVTFLLTFSLCAACMPCISMKVVLCLRNRQENVLQIMHISSHLLSHLSSPPVADLFSWIKRNTRGSTIYGQNIKMNKAVSSSFSFYPSFLFLKKRKKHNHYWCITQKQETLGSAGSTRSLY